MAQVDVGSSSGLRKLVPAETLETSARQQYTQVLAEARAEVAKTVDRVLTLTRDLRIDPKLVNATRLQVQPGYVSGRAPREAGYVAALADEAARLAEVMPSPVVELNRVVAVAQAHGAASAWPLLQALSNPWDQLLNGDTLMLSDGNTGSQGFGFRRFHYIHARQ